MNDNGLETKENETCTNDKIEPEHIQYSGEGELGWVLWIAADRDDRRIFLSLKFSIPGFFLEVIKI